MLGSSWVTAWLAASQEGLSSISEWVFMHVHETLCSVTFSCQQPNGHYVFNIYIFDINIDEKILILPFFITIIHKSSLIVFITIAFSFLPQKKTVVFIVNTQHSDTNIRLHQWFSTFVRPRPGKFFFIRRGPGTGPRPAGWETLAQNPKSVLRVMSRSDLCGKSYSWKGGLPVWKSWNTESLGLSLQCVVFHIA
jgi:hypothetical protein